MPGLEVIKEVFKDQPKGYYALSWKRGSKWGDEFFKSLKAMEKWINSLDDKRDLYFCTTPLSAPKRVKGNVLGSMYLWQDLDEVDPRKITPKPSIAWESSPDRYQALWKLDKIYEPEEIEYINKALAQKVHADHGSWILTKVLRIPNTHNYKYKEAPLGKLLWNKKKRTYTMEELTHFTEPETTSPTEILGKYTSRISEKAYNLLTAREVSAGSRSDTLWYLEHELAKAGVPLDEIYVLIKNSAWNKFKGRADEEERLTNEISRAFEDEIIGGRKEEEQQQYHKPDFGKLTIQPDTDLMSDMSLYPGWLIKNFWTRKSHGIVAGEPKSFKSTLVMDMMVSVASGKPFLGQFEVVDKGAVLMIQNENASWIMKDRLSKIRAHKGLTGSVEVLGNSKYTVNFPPELPMYYINQQGFSLSNKDHRQMLEEMLVEIKPKLVVMDPLYLMFDGDINSAKELNPALSWLLYIKEKYEFSLILVHHWGKSKNSNRGGQRMLGSATLHGWIESAWYISVVGASAEEDVDQGDSDSVDLPSSHSSLVVEREFRGAGKYPLTAIKVGMGEFGSDTYSVEVGVAKLPVKGEKEAPSDEDTRQEILALLDVRPRMHIDEIVRDIGITLRVAQDCCAYLEQSGLLAKDGFHYELAR